MFTDSSNLWSNLHPEEHGFGHMFHRLFLSSEDNRKAFLHSCLAQGAQTLSWSPPARPPLRGGTFLSPASLALPWPVPRRSCSSGDPLGLLLSPQRSAGSWKQPSMTPALI